MSKYAGWEGLSEADVKRLGAPKARPTKPPVKRSTAVGVPYPRLCVLCGLPEPVAEYRFHASRKWRFDWSWPVQKVALEIEGGVFMAGGGRHSRGAGFRADLEKYGEAAADGWLVFRVLPEQLESVATLEWLRRAMSTRGAR